jgi:ParB family chromosome partitioning protein
MAPDRLEALAHSIATHGLLNPITVRQEDQTYTIIAGRRRIAAFKLLGRDTIPATVLHVGEHAALEMKLAENVARTNLTPVEEMMQLAELLKATPDGVDAVAHAIGRNVNWVLDRLDLADYPEALLGYIHERRISLAAAKHLARITPLGLRDEYITQAARSGINASTASLWRQQTEQVAGQPMTDDATKALQPYPETTTEIRMTCFCCRKQVIIENTQPVRVCDPCLTEISAAGPPTP